MSVRVHPPQSDAVAEIPEGSVEAYVAQGWTRVAAEPEKRGPGRPKKSE